MSARKLSQAKAIGPSAVGSLGLAWICGRLFLYRLQSGGLAAAHGRAQPPEVLWAAAHGREAQFCLRSARIVSLKLP